MKGRAGSALYKSATQGEYEKGKQVRTLVPPGMGLKNSRPLPLATAELHVVPFLQRRIRSWHLDHVTQLVLLRYRALTRRFCIDELQLSTVLGIKDQEFIQELMQLFLPKTPTRVQCMVDAMEILIALILVCQAPTMKSRFEAILDVIDAEDTGFVTTTDLVVCKL